MLCNVNLPHLSAPVAPSVLNPLLHGVHVLSPAALYVSTSHFKHVSPSLSRYSPEPHSNTIGYNIGGSQVGTHKRTNIMFTFLRVSIMAEYVNNLFCQG